MRLAMLETEIGVRLVGLRGQYWIDLQGFDSDLPGSIDQWLLESDEGRNRLAAAVAHGPVLDQSIVGFLPPIRHPRKILCVGKNFAEHAREMGTAPPEEPLIFSKLVTTLIGHECEIVLPKESSQVDYEAELVVVIGKAGRRINEAAALSHVAGYTCGHDVSARDWQRGKPGGQWLLGKSFDTFAPLGPCLVSADEVPDVANLDLELRLNGTTMQRANTRNMIYSVPRLISYVSQVCTLEAGDLLFTGTPDGVGFARNPQVFLAAGDQVEVEIQGLGLLRNRVVAFDG
jgi:2-keto-4-pentenoate hydratase/2-oxohepta-3-ene-1,7-dioic acid hydratase in catechol pathway